jgi:hypothetical protein
MPVKSTIDPNTGVIVHKATEQLSMPDLLGALDRITGHPLFQPGANALWDLSKVTLADAEAKKLCSGNAWEWLSGRSETPGSPQGD